MKSLALLLTLTFCSAAAVFADNPPPISARQALDIAEKDLAGRNLTQKIYIVSITLERPSMFSKNSFWILKWSDSIPASNPDNREIGMKVRMDGTPVRLVKEPH